MNYVNGNQKIFFDPNSLSLDDQVTLSKQSYSKRKLWMTIIVIGSFLLQMLPYTIVQNLTPTLSSVLFINWLGNNTVLANLILSFGLIIAAFTGPLIGNWLSKTKKPKFIFILGISLSSVGFILFSLGYLISNNGISSNSLNIVITTLVLLILSGISQIGTLIFSTLGINYLISKWFPQSKKGLILGIVFMGGAVGNMWITPLVENLLMNLFLNSSYAIFILFGGLSLIVGIIVCLIIVIDPIPIYESIYLSSIIDKEQLKMDEINKIVVTPHRTFKLIWYKIFIVGFFFLSAGVGTIITQAQETVANGLIELNDGFNRNNSLKILSNITIIYGFGCLLGNPIGGFLNDKIGIKKSFFIGFILELIAAFSMLFSPLAPHILPYVWGITAGLGIYIFTSSAQYMCSYLFGNKNQTKHLGIVSFPYFLGFGLFLFIDGLIVGKTGLNSSGTEWLNVNNFLGHQISGTWPIVWIICIIILTIGFLMIFVSLIVLHHLGIIFLSKYENTNLNKLIRKKYGLFLWIARFFGLYMSKDITESKYWQKILKKAQLDNNKFRYDFSMKIEDKIYKNKFKLIADIEQKIKNKFSKKNKELTSNHIKSHKILFYQNLSRHKLDKYLNKVSSKDLKNKNNLQKFYFQNKVSKKISNYKKLETKPIDELQNKILANDKKLNEKIKQLEISKQRINEDYEAAKKFYRNRARYLNNLLIKHLEEDKAFKFDHKYYHK
ncbi:MFS transporter [Mycoplasmoides alvi]|uniref:MFS transporter n=1 Tax=Mycoplasmoides alvi TaxID=78580 RepID=UPI00051B0F41|nr:MFS transporter [Mycoplasmoides alvi]